jgi:hypothetical protein
MKRINYNAVLTMERLKRSKLINLYRPSDYFEGVITENGKPASKFYGTYCGFLNFDGVRYWDGRYL